LPSAKVLEQKQQQVAEISEKISKSVAGVLVDYKGITVAEDTALRAELRKAGVHYEVIKNTLLRLAIKDTPLENLDEVLSGTTAIALSEDDHIAPARIITKFASKHKTFQIKGGFLDGEVISLEKIDSLAKLPTREVLLATVVGAFQAPMAAFARAIQAIIDKQGEAAAPAEAAAEAPAEA
jgi:large subunit ribosomal protein L10